MAYSDKYSAMLAYLQTCPVLSGLLNFQSGKDNAVRIVTQGSNVSGNVKFIDGSVAKKFDFVIEFYKPLNNVPYVAEKGTGNQNLGTLLDVQALIDWLDEQQTNDNFPDFGANCSVDSVTSLSNEPNLAWIDTSATTPIAKYTVTVRAEYIDYSRAV